MRGKSFSQEFVSLGFERYQPIIDDWEAFVEAARAPLPVTIWANPMRTTPTALEAALKLVPISWYPGAYRFPAHLSPSATLPFLAGHYQIQEEAAMASIALMDPQPGETILELCAAPGNKTSQIAVRMNSTGTIVANDRSRQRLGILRRSVTRLGLTNVAITVYDGTSYPGRHESFDRVLADVPCSGEGTIRRFKKSTPFISPKRRAHLRNIQSAILDRAIALCRPGGLIVYATCTFAPEENEAIVSAALEKYAGLLALEKAELKGLNTSPGLTAWDGEAYDSDMHRAMRIWPHQNDTGGFFTALIRKTDSLNLLDANLSPVMLDQEPMELPAQAFEARFGIPATTFDNHWLQQFGKFLFIRSFETLPPDTPPLIQAGMPFCRPPQKSQKLKTGAAMTWANRANRNIVSLTRSQVYSYGRRETFGIDDLQLTPDVTPGYVLLKYKAMHIGLGFLRTEHGNSTLESLLPRHWVHALSNIEHH